MPQKKYKTKYVSLLHAPHTNQAERQIHTIEKCFIFTFYLIPFITVLLQQGSLEGAGGLPSLSLLSLC